MSWNAKTALQLGRVSNLPTVWSNTLAGAALAGGNPLNGNLLIMMFAMSLAYIGGMFLNDAFDRKIDAKERPERPIPAKQVKAAEVFAAGFTLLAGSVMFAAIAAMSWGHNLLLVALLSIALCGAIVLYDMWHKDNPISPLIMGICRVLVLLVAGFSATDSPSVVLYYGALAMLLYLAGLTYTAKQENLGEVKNLWPLALLAAPLIYGLLKSTTDFQVIPATVILALWTGYALYFVRRRNKGDIPKAVVSMIAGISIVDALLISTVSSLPIAALALMAFGLTLFLQRYIAGT